MYELVPVYELVLDPDFPTLPWFPRLLIDRMALMSDGCQPVEAAAEGGDAGPGHAAPGGHDGPTGTNLGASAFAYIVFMDGRQTRNADS